jgi:hypothetical protein
MAHGAGAAPNAARSFCVDDLIRGEGWHRDGGGAKGRASGDDTGHAPARQPESERRRTPHTRNHTTAADAHRAARRRLVPTGAVQYCTYSTVYGSAVPRRAAPNAGQGRADPSSGHGPPSHSGTRAAAVRRWADAGSAPRATRGPASLPPSRPPLRPALAVAQRAEGSRIAIRSPGAWRGAVGGNRTEPRRERQRDGQRAASRGPG